MGNRRAFLNKLGILSATALAANVQPAWSRNLDAAIKKAEGMSAAELSTEKDFWKTVRQAYDVPDNFINLNNGGVAPAPRMVAETMKKYYDFCNQGPSFYMWRELDKGREGIRKRLAVLAGCDAEEIAMQRNASESLETVIFGIELKAGDEVVLSHKDYPNMIAAWKQREKREGIKLVWIDPELPNENEDYLVSQYTNAFTGKTKVVHITHLVNWLGQKMPVRPIADAAKKKNILVLVDGAHSFAQYEFLIPDLNCDFFGTSLHKWLGAPIGTGMLHIRREKIASVWPLFGAGDKEDTDIRKFEHLGTRPFFIEEAIDKAIDFHEMIGIGRKEERLHYLKNYWMEQVKDLPGIKLHTSFKKEFGCAIGLIEAEGGKTNALSGALWENHHIHTTSIDWPGIKGVRITPNVYTSVKELDVLVKAIREFASAL